MSAPAGIDASSRTSRPTFVDRVNVVARPVAQRRPDPSFRGAVAVQRRGVEGPDAEVPGVADRGDRRVVVDVREQPADRRATEAEAADREAGASERDPLGRVDGHGSSPWLRARLTRAMSVAYRPVLGPTDRMLNERPGAIVRLLSCRSDTGEVLGIAEGDRWLPAATVARRRPPHDSGPAGRRSRRPRGPARRRPGRPDRRRPAARSPRPSCSPRSHAPARSSRSAGTTASTPRRKASSRRPRP